MIAVTSADHPTIMVPRLKHPGKLARAEKLYFTGTYTLQGDMAVVVMSKIGEAKVGTVN